MDFNQLKALPREQLVATAQKLRLQVHHKAKAETIAKQIWEKTYPNVTSKQPAEDAYIDPRLATTKQDVYLTVAQVEEAVAPVKKEQPLFETKYYDLDGFEVKDTEDARVVKFSCLGAVESHNMTTAQRILRQKANLMKRGKISLMAHREHFAKGTSQGVSAYTNNVLMA
jgi:hypothetical protein